MNSTENQIIKLYTGYMDRAADSEGLNFWIDQANSGGGILDIANAFAQSPEYQGIYGGLSNAALIDKIYDNLFGRDPDAGGLGYWTAQLESGVSSGRLIVDIMSGAQGNDKTILENTVIVSSDWTHANAHLPFVLADAKNAVNSIGKQQGNGVTVEFGSDVFLPDQAGWIADIAAAWAQWGNHGRLDVKLNFMDLGSDTLAFAYPRNELFTGQTNQNGVPITQSNVGIEINTGKDMNGDLPDIVITIAMSLGKFGLYDRVSISAHEIGHAIGFRTELFDFDQDYSTVTSWDQFLTFPNGTQQPGAFNGPEAGAIYGGPVPITGYYNATHPADIGSIMDPTFSQGEVRTVGVLDKAMMHDAGILV